MQKKEAFVKKTSFIAYKCRIYIILLLEPQLRLQPL